MKAPRPPSYCPRAEHPTSVARLMSGRDGWTYGDRRGHPYPRSSARRDRQVVIRAALEAGFSAVVDAFGATLARKEGA